MIQGTPDRSDSSTSPFAVPNVHLGDVLLLIGRKSAEARRPALERCKDRDIEFDDEDGPKYEVSAETSHAGWFGTLPSNKDPSACFCMLPDRLLYCRPEGSPSIDEQAAQFVR
jgi:hypothetical protein